MGYFSNGAEGDYYEREYCDRCIHGAGKLCPVWSAHLLYAYPECGKKSTGESILNMLIPQNADHTRNEECEMFVDRIRALAASDAEGKPR